MICIQFRFTQTLLMEILWATFNYMQCFLLINDNLANGGGFGARETYWIKHTLNIHKAFVYIIVVDVSQRWEEATFRSCTLGEFLNSSTAAVHLSVRKFNRRNPAEPSYSLPVPTPPPSLRSLLFSSLSLAHLLVPQNKCMGHVRVEGGVVDAGTE